MFKKISFILFSVLLAVFLVSCASTTVVPTPTQTPYVLPPVVEYPNAPVLVILLRLENPTPKGERSEGLPWG